MAALTRGDDSWIRRHFFGSLLGVAIFNGLCCLFLAIVIRPLLALWVGGSVNPSTSLVVSMAIYGVVAATAHVIQNLLFSVTITGRYC